MYLTMYLLNLALPLSHSIALNLTIDIWRLFLYIAYVSFYDVSSNYFPFFITPIFMLHKNDEFACAKCIKGQTFKMLHSICHWHLMVLNQSHKLDICSHIKYVISISSVDWNKKLNDIQSWKIFSNTKTLWIVLVYVGQKTYV